MKQFQGNTKNYVVDSTATSLGDGREESIEYPCGADYMDSEEIGADVQKVGSHMEME